MTVWIPGDSYCLDANGVYDPGTDILIMQVPEILDFTTDTNYAAFTDVDGDGCSLTGSGPSTLTSMGTCWDVGAATLTLGAAGTVGSDSPLSDITFRSELRNTVAGPEPSSGATCSDPPAIDFKGTAPPGASGRKRRAVEPPEKEAKAAHRSLHTGGRAKTRMLFAGRTRGAEYPKPCSGIGSANTWPPLPYPPETPEVGRRMD